jgi:hypothetical protein
MKNLKNEFFTGWDFEKTPILFYKPNVQELLINFPHQPRGFSLYNGFNPLGDDTIYVRNDTTFFNIDDQNTSKQIEGINVLVVADPCSRMRNQLRGTFMNYPHEIVNSWLDQWNFVQSPYDEIELILHEAFHVYQNKRAPEKEANEFIVAQYPLLDPINNALYVLEGRILKDALLTDDQSLFIDKVKEFIAVRSFRQNQLDSDFVDYENLNEYNEGLAKYIEYKFLRNSEQVEPIKEMFYYHGFNGYRGFLSKRLENAIKNMVHIVAVDDDRFGNKFGSGPFRFKLYELGACQALLLDKVFPTWKEKIFIDTVFLTNLLKQSFNLSGSEVNNYLNRAKLEYNYKQAYDEKLDFEKAGRKRIEEKLASILQTKQTLVKILYGDFTQRIGLGGFTPFGVTQISKRSAIYEMVPIKIIFKEGVELQMKKVVPVLIDRDKKIIAFAIDFPAGSVNVNTKDVLETDEFRLSAINRDIHKEGNTIEIKLK